MSRHSRVSDEIDVISSSDDEVPAPPSKPPITIRGVGHITMFGLNSRFDTDFPSELIGRVAPEELSDTLGRINNVLKRHVQMSSRWLLCGLLFCCCSFGCSLFPVVCLNRRTVTAVEKTLDHENICLYHKLGLHWRLVKRPMDGSRLTEYILVEKFQATFRLNVKKYQDTNKPEVATNVAVVRLKKMGKRFEIACYKNKVVNWRNKSEKDINEVLQTQTVFNNVSKGQVAKKDELTAAFGTDDQLEICKIVRSPFILEKGDLQVSDKERQAATDQSFKEVSQLIASMVVNPETKRPIPPSVIDKALHELHFSLKPNKNAKQQVTIKFIENMCDFSFASTCFFYQALEAIPKLREAINIERAKMRIRIAMPSHEAKITHTRLKSLFSDLEMEDWAEGGLEMVGLIEPGNFRITDELVRKESKGHGRVEILSLKDVREGEVEIS
ncbi:rRNA metabolism protein, SBDS family [Dictyocaulus viviparus]|uniref:rRNA metabolism protein, SBDS family n=1 Tax=Dictyocaulus viviparus TaxID=29172 RepID=A0A0D8Y9I4_DICVI|nr:rRNA metabolism protein, SBDS family [Dictyocaulus viviparus]